MFNDLAADGELSKLLTVGKQTVINYVSKRKKELCKKTYDTAMYTLHAPCEAQVDFGKIPIVKPNGSEENFSYLVVSFPWSNAGFMQLCCLC